MTCDKCRRQQDGDSLQEAATSPARRLAQEGCQKSGQAAGISSDRGTVTSPARRHQWCRSGQEAGTGQPGHEPSAWDWQ